MELVRSQSHGTVDGHRIPVTDPNWTTPLRGLRTKGDQPLTHELLIVAATHLAANVAVACDLSAAHLWSAVLPSGFGLDVNAQACAIATTRGGSRTRSGGIRGRRLELPAGHVTRLRGISVTTPARTWVDCAPLVSWTDLVAMGDGILRANLATRHELAEMVRWARGRRGVRSARLALTILDEGSESPAESWVRALLFKGGVARPMCNVTVKVGGWKFRLDIAWTEEKVAVEYDGEEHHGTDREGRDRWRRQLLEDAGWIVIVVRKADLGSLEALAGHVKHLLATRGPSDHSRAQ